MLRIEIKTHCVDPHCEHAPRPREEYTGHRKKMLKEVHCSKRLGKMYLESASNPGKNYVNRTKVRKRWELQERHSVLHITRKLVCPCGVDQIVNVKPREPTAACMVFLHNHHPQCCESSVKEKEE